MVKLHLRRLLLLWRCVFPASLREQEMEQQRGDYFTWRVTLEGRAGALCGQYRCFLGPGSHPEPQKKFHFSSAKSFFFFPPAMKKLQQLCPQLVTDDVISRLFTPLACAVSLLAKLVSDWFPADASKSSFTNETRENPNPTCVCVCVCLSLSHSSRLPALLRSHGSSLQSVCLVYRLRVYELLALLPPLTYQGTNTPLAVFGGAMVNVMVNQNSPARRLVLPPQRALVCS